MTAPTTSRAATVAAEAAEMLRTLREAAVAAAIGGRAQARERAERAHDEAVALVAAGRTGDAHSLLTTALDPRAVTL